MPTKKTSIKKENNTIPTPIKKTASKKTVKEIVKKTLQKPTKKTKSIKDDESTLLLLNTIVEAIKDIKGEKIVSIDLRQLSEAITDYFVVCEASTNTQLMGIVGNIEKKVKENCNQKPYKRNIEKESIWLILDYVNIVVHLFLPEQRAFYNLEECWNDGILNHH